MAETYTGEIRDGIVIFEGTPPPLPPGTRVRIEPIEPAEHPIPTLAERYADFIGIVDDLPPDLAEQHDHYIHGAPRRDAK